VPQTVHPARAASSLLDKLAPAEERLFKQLDLKRLPHHIAVIMDGNGRWAKRRHLPRVAGHRAGVNSARMVIETCARLNIPALTLYAFSMENWRRPRAEIDFLMRLLCQYLRRELPVIHKNDIRMAVIGRPERLPTPVQRDLEQAIRLTAANSGMQLTVALNYSGRAEIVDAVNSILLKKQSNGVGGRGPKPVDEDTISRHLYTAGLPDPDLIIRTSGEMRLSNFLLWQIAYAEIYVTETLWPDFNRECLLLALLDFQKRERRYGGLGDAAKEDSLAARISRR
jgi:undecaprenyl diphosphate synthase